MSQENIELVRSTCAAWDRGEYDAVDRAHPDIEFVLVEGPLPGTWAGLAGMTRRSLS